MLGRVSRASTTRPAARTLAGALTAVIIATGLSSQAKAATAPPSVSWAVHAIAQPTRFSPTDAVDGYTLLVENTGAQAASAGATLTDRLPEGVTAADVPRLSEAGWKCPGASVGATVIECTTTEAIPAHSQSRAVIVLQVAVAPGTEGPLVDQATVTGGGAPAGASTREETELASPSLPALAFEPLEFGASAFAPDGSLETQAGGHPSALATTFHFPTHQATEEDPHPVDVEEPKQIVIDLPPGLAGNPRAATECPLTLLQEAINNRSQCPPSSAVGEITLVQPQKKEKASGEAALILYNMVPEKGYPAELGVYDPTYQRAQLLYGTLVGSGADTHVRVSSGPLNKFVPNDGVSTLLYGNPAAQDQSGELPVAFFTNPSDCTQTQFTTEIHVDSWQHPGRLNADGSPDFSDLNWKAARSTSPAVGGCGVLQFHPLLSIAPEAGHRGADEPAGYEADLSVPQNEDPNGLATPPVKNTVVTLPVGVSIAPPGAEGLAGCQEAGSEGINLASPGAGSCPAAANVGDAEVHTPLLKEPLTGGVFVAQPPCGAAGQGECSEAAAETGGVFALYLELGSENSGVHIKFKGKVEVGGNGAHSRETGLAPGQVRTTFAQTPQQPFSDLVLRFDGGAKAPLANPQSCGTFQATSAITPWSAMTEAAALPSPAFSIGGCNGGFTPAFAAGTVNPQAGAYSPFALTFSRHDREDDLAGITVSMPPGLLGRVAGVAQCSDAQANAGTCPPEAQIGTATAAAGAGPQPLWQSGPVYLTGPYRGAPFGLSVVVPAKAGPYNLGNIVVRAAIHIDPHTAQLTVVSDPLPQSVDGVPLRIRTVNVTIDRPAFTFNPTSCEPAQVTASLTSLSGLAASGASRFQAAGCARLAFNPSFTVSTLGRTSKANGAALDVKVAQRAGEADIHKVDVQLPLQLPSRLTTLQKACLQAQFDTDPATCPSGSVVGMAVAHTPLLNVPLSGPAILVSHGGAAFPDLVLVLQGEGVRIDLIGNTDIKHGITFSRFETVPDAPISSFELNLPEGPHSALAAFGNLCAQSLVMPTTIVGQSGAQVTRSTKIAVTGCRAVTITKRKLSGKNVVLTFFLTAKGTVTVTGIGLKRYHKTLGTGSHEIKVGLSNAGLSMRRHHRKIKIKVALRSGSKTSSSTTTLRL
jgi:archaellum component FlaG (FlaF/FlaG flagellin family)